jgi:hypothetical protein
LSLDNAARQSSVSTRSSVNSRRNSLNQPFHHETTKNVLINNADSDM